MGEGELLRRLRGRSEASRASEGRKGGRQGGKEDGREGRRESWPGWLRSVGAAVMRKPACHAVPAETVHDRLGDARAVWRCPALFISSVYLYICVCVFVCGCDCVCVCFVREGARACISHVLESACMRGRMRAYIHPCLRVRK